MLRKLLFAMTLCVPLFVSTTAVAEVVKWVDKDGVTHFGNAQFAPAGRGEVVDIAPANGMVATDQSILKKRAPNRQMNVTTIKRHKVENPRGWRGHYSRSRGGHSSRNTRRSGWSR